MTTVEESTSIEAIVLFFSANLLLSLTTFDHLTEPLADLFAYRADEAVRTVLTLNDQKDRESRLRLAQRPRLAPSIDAVDAPRTAYPARS
jgi:hypothetical protein